MIWIQPPYEWDKVSIISVEKRVEKQARYVRQNGSEHFAIIDFIIEPYEGSSICFENEALIQDDLKGNKEWERLFPILVINIYEGLNMFIENQYNEKNRAIGNFKFKLVSLAIHPLDSKFMDFKIATYIGLRDIFDPIESDKYRVKA
ncbi:MULTISPECIES: hypothetical protein [unclassified Paenibacillus]|uniref:hypothetical protein n=1 Tax=unclassified Paenibacillus TaxID=185978 RepID=UPI0036D37D07